MVIDIVYSAIEEINNDLPKGRQVGTSVDTILFGKSSILDSLGLVNLIVAVEQQIEDELDVGLSLADERAMSQKSSPFRTIGTLVQYILMLLRETGIAN
tara:strand:- start:15526 stop:15822 length:297 start_codon:yes stop_codon:yes gene_type:complete